MSGVSGIVRMNLAAYDDITLMRLRGVMMLSLLRGINADLRDKCLDVLAAIDEEFLLRGREP